MRCHKGEGRGEYSKREEVKVSKETRGGNRDMKIAYDKKWWNRYIMIPTHNLLLVWDGLFVFQYLFSLIGVYKF